MKVEQQTFNRYATELHLDSLLTERDVSRATVSFRAKKDGFIHDITSLASDIRLALSVKHFRLSEHTNKVFKRIHGSVLPQFLGGALSKVFTDCGDIREDMCLTTVCALIMFCDSVKRVDPLPSRRPRLEDSLWSGLRARFEEGTHVASSIAERAQQDLDFRQFLTTRVKGHFRDVLSRADLNALEYGTGPGKNLDREEACTAPDWFLDQPRYYGPASRAVVRFVGKQLNRLPFKRKRELSWFHKKRSDKGRSLKKPGFGMRCSAQPKSNKALRGVGVMDAARMAYQISLQKVFYRDCLCDQMPLDDQDSMKENLRDNWANVGTIDLSAASDRLYWFLLVYLGRGLPWFDAAYELRTRVLSLPTGELECAAPVMGEAITFPLLSLALYAISMAVCDEMGGGHEFVRIYGDDIQTKWYHETIFRLEQCGFEVSKTKSYPPDSQFKESCEAHYVEHQGRLRSCRPTYLFSAPLNRRNRLTHVDSFRLLTLAKESFLRNPWLAEAACKTVERFTSLKLPLVPYTSPYLGRPTISRASHGALELVMQDDDVHTLSERGAMRKTLQMVGSEAPNSLKLSQKRKYLMMVRTIKKIRVRDTLLELENHIFLRIGLRSRPDEVQELMASGLSTQDIRSWVQQNVSEDDIVSGLTFLIELVQQVEIR